MRKDKEQAISLRRDGKSYNQIASELGVPKSTLSDWFRNQNWSNDLSKKLSERAKKSHIVRIQRLNKIRGDNLKQLYEQARKEAIEEFDLLKYHPLFISGLMIYWGEGNKSSKSNCCVANTEPLMIKLFLSFLKNICGFEGPKMKAWLLLYPDLDEDKCKEYWINNAGLKPEDFNKSMVILGKHKTRRLSYGVCSVGVSSAYLKCKIMKWIEMLAIELSQENYIAGIV